MPPERGSAAGRKCLAPPYYFINHAAKCRTGGRGLFGDISSVLSHCTRRSFHESRIGRMTKRRYIQAPLAATVTRRLTSRYRQNAYQRHLTVVTNYDAKPRGGG